MCVSFHMDSFVKACYNSSNSLVEAMLPCQYASRLCVSVRRRRRRFALMCVGNKMMRHVFLYLVLTLWRVSSHVINGWKF